MEAKTLEVRDKGTFIPVMGVQVSGADGYLMRRAGFRGAMIYLVHLAGERCAYDPYTWADRTMRTAHQFIEKEWDNLQDGDVVDVEFILGESMIQKPSEQKL